MSKRPVFTLMLALTTMAPALAADKEAPKSDKPAVILRLAALEQLRSNFRYLAEMVGQAEKAKQLDKMIESKLGEKDLQGIDAKKPIGAYGWIGSSGIDSSGVVLLPIADKKVFLDLLSDTLDVKPEKDDDDVYTLNLDKLPVPIYFRFANGYAYITVRDKEALDKGRLLAPTAVLPEDRKGILTLTVNIDRIPDNLKEMGLGVIENQLADLKEKEDSKRTGAQKKLFEGFIDEYGAFLKSLLNYGGETTLRLELDREAGDLSLTLSLAAKPDSPLAQTIRELGQYKSWTSALVRPDSALHQEMNVRLPKKLRDLAVAALQEQEKRQLSKAKNQQERDLLKLLQEIIEPPIQAGELDMAYNMQGPNSEGVFTLVGGIRLKDGAKAQRNLLRFAAHFPGPVVLDAEKAGQVRIHRINPDEKIRKDTRRTLGDNPLYFAIRGDVFFFSGGDKGLEALKEALAIAPKTGQALEMQVGLAHLAPLFNKPAQAEIARQVFGDDKDGDRIRLRVQGGDALTLRLSLKAKLIEYIVRLEKAKKE